MKIEEQNLIQPLLTIPLVISRFYFKLWKLHIINSVKQ
jgi:hypothetical protein